MINNTLPSSSTRNTAAFETLGKIKQKLSEVKTSLPTQTKQETPKPPVRGLFGDVVSSLAQRGTGPSPALEEAQKAYQQSINNLYKFRASAADKRADIYSDPVSARVMQGRDAALQQANAETLSAYQGAVQEAQKGIEYAQNQQTIEQSALQQAGALSNPQQLGPGNTYIDPTNGQSISSGPTQIAPGNTLVNTQSGQTIAGGIGGYANFQTAEQVMGLIRQYPDAGYSYNPDLTPQQNLQNAQAALKLSPTYQKATFGQPGASNVLGGAQLTSAIDLTQKSSEIQAVANGAEANFKLLVDTAERGGVNDTNIPALNRLIQNVDRGIASAEAVTLFRATLESVRAQYASILGGGQATDQARQAASQQIPDDISLGALKSLETQLKYEAQNRVAGYQNQILSLTRNSQGGQSNKGPLKVGKYTYEMVNGKYVLVN